MIDGFHLLFYADMEFMGQFLGRVVSSGDYQVLGCLAPRTPLVTLVFGFTKFFVIFVVFAL